MIRTPIYSVPQGTNTALLKGFMVPDLNPMKDFEQNRSTSLSLTQ